WRDGGRDIRRRSAGTSGWNAAGERARSGRRPQGNFRSDNHNGGSGPEPGGRDAGHPPVAYIITMFRDILYALRGFRSRPLFFLTVVGTIALGLGFNAALFTLFSNMVLRPFAVLDPYSLYAFTWTNRAGNPHDFSWR